MSRKEKTQVAKITVFLTSIFVIFLSVSYAFINMTLTGTRRQVINAGTLEVELEEENEITIENAFPIYDEVGMIQDAFVFHLRNKDQLRVNYTLRLEDITQSAEKLSTADVKYGLKKGNDVTIDLLSNLENGVIEEGSLGKGETVTYELRLWIRDGVTENEKVAGKSLSYKIAVDVTGLVESDAPVIEMLSDPIAGSSTYLFEGKVTDESGIESVLVNGEAVEVLEDGTFSKGVTLKDGNNEITVYAKDMWENEKEEKYTVIYDVEAPNLTVSAPVSSSSSSPTFTTSPSYTVSGTVSDLSGIKSVTVNGEEATLDGTNWSYSLALAANTTTTVTVIATDNVGTTSTVTRYVHYDNSAPSLTVSSPSSTSLVYTTSSSYTISGTASDLSGVKSVTVNGQAASLSGNNWSYNLGLAANNTTTVTIVATDNVGRTTTQTRYLFYDSANPTLSVTAPSGNISVTSSSYTVRGTASDASGIASVTVNGTSVGLSSGSFSRTITLSTGNNTITVVAKDKAGRTTTITRTITYSAYKVISSTSGSGLGFTPNFIVLGHTGKGTGGHSSYDATGAMISTNTSGSLAGWSNVTINAQDARTGTASFGNGSYSLPSYNLYMSIATTQGFVGYATAYSASTFAANNNGFTQTISGLSFTPNFVAIISPSTGTGGNNGKYSTLWGFTATPGATTLTGTANSKISYGTNSVTIRQDYQANWRFGTVRYFVARI